MYVRSLFFLLVLAVGNVGAVVSPVVAFNPDWNKIFTGESINLTCNVEAIMEGDVVYHWFKDEYWIHSGKTFTITSAKRSNSGIYQCQTSIGDRSDSARLEVHNGYAILQVPPNVYERDNLTLRCHHYPGNLAGQTIFYKNNEVIKDWGPEDELYIENIDMTSSSKYKCTKQVKHHLLYYQHSDEASISVQELFSLPTILLSSHSMVEGEPITLTCHTRISSLRQNTLLEFSFYQDGQNIQKFSSSNKYEIGSAKQRDAGDYKCEVKTSDDRIKKMSTILTVQVRSPGDNELFNQTEIEATSKPGTSHFIIAVSVTSLVLVLVLIVTALIFLYKARHVSNPRPSKVDSEDPDDVTENIYTELDTNDRCQDSSQNPHKPIGTENQFVLI
ncbi:high affinity immunoglobulin gamma Fc receptor I-like isoform X2 [Dendropsophus ebraccatus]|uniref:high affinity immunoglobulin gamma Fc receptor I-like isoform X2 n=1 Tax=Dendropsophus ebraccatus TaxID=150705 RepID=UPI00383133E4